MFKLLIGRSKNQINYATNAVLTVIPILLKIVAKKHGGDFPDFPDLLQTAYHFCSQYTDVYTLF